MQYQFVVADSVQAMLEMVERGEADVAIAAISMTLQREAYLDFAHPYLQSGLQIMTLQRQTGLLDALGALPWSDVLKVMGVISALILIAAHLIWLVERGRNPDFPRDYLRGVSEGVWWSVVTVVTVGYGDRTPKRPVGRAVAIVWMFVGIFLMASHCRPTAPIARSSVAQYWRSMPTARINDWCSAGSARGSALPPS